MIYNIILLS